MSFWLIEKRVSVKCHRGKHGECKNKSGGCGCNCHRVIQQNKEIQNSSDWEILDDYVCGCWREFWRPFR